MEIDWFIHLCVCLSRGVLVNVADFFNCTLCGLLRYKPIDWTKLFDTGQHDQTAPGQKQDDSSHHHSHHSHSVV